jgi:hypothetical protein
VLGTCTDLSCRSAARDPPTAPAQLLASMQLLASLLRGGVAATTGLGAATSASGGELRCAEGCAAAAGTSDSSIWPLLLHASAAWPAERMAAFHMASVSCVGSVPLWKTTTLPRWAHQEQNASFILRMLHAVHLGRHCHSIRSEPPTSPLTQPHTCLLHSNCCSTHSLGAHHTHFTHTQSWFALQYVRAYQ